MNKEAHDGMASTLIIARDSMAHICKEDITVTVMAPL